MLCFFVKMIKKIILAHILAISFNLSYAGEMINLEHTQLQDILLNKKRDKLLIFFTTWCSYCKPITLSKNLPKDQVIFISVDEDLDAIRQFSKEMPYDLYYIKPSDNRKNLVNFSEALGIKFATIDKKGEVWTSFPYITHLDKDNKVIEDGINPEDLQKYLR